MSLTPIPLDMLIALPKLLTSKHILVVDQILDENCFKCLDVLLFQLKLKQALNGYEMVFDVFSTKSFQSCRLV